MEKALEVMDHLAARVTISAASAALAGSAFATFKNHPVARTSMSAALSSAMAATACFGMERLSHAALSRSVGLLGDEDGGGAEGTVPPGDDDAPMMSRAAAMTYGSHALGGFLGGGVVGFLFQNRALPGALLFTPIMLGVGKVELDLQEYRERRLEELLENDNEEQPSKPSS